MANEVEVAREDVLDSLCDREAVYRGVPIYSVLEEEGLRFWATLQNGEKFTSLISPVHIMNMVDAIEKRYEARKRVKVDTPCLTFHKGVWKPGKITTMGPDGSVNIKLDPSGNVKVAKEEIATLIVLDTEENKSVLEEWVEYDELAQTARADLKVAEEELAKTTKKLKTFNPAPFMKLAEEEVKAIEEERAKFMPKPKPVFTRKKFIRKKK